MMKSLILLTLIAFSYAHEIKYLTIAGHLNHNQLYDHVRYKHIEICNHGSCPDFLVLVDLDSRKVVVDNLQEIGRNCMSYNIKSILNKREDKRDILDRVMDKLNEQTLVDLFEKCKLNTNNEKQKIIHEYEKSIIIPLLIIIFTILFTIVLILVGKLECIERHIIDNANVVNTNYSSDSDSSWSDSDSSSSD